MRPWVLLLRGTELARGPDNEPLVRCDEPLAWVADTVLREGRALFTTSMLLANLLQAHDFHLHGATLTPGELPLTLTTSG